MLRAYRKVPSVRRQAPLVLPLVVPALLLASACTGAPAAKPSAAPSASASPSPSGPSYDAWAGDCAYWWVAGLNAYRRRPRVVSVALHAFLLFMMFNATVVFATGATRWIGILALTGLIALWISKRRERRCGWRR